CQPDSAKSRNAYRNPGVVVTTPSATVEGSTSPRTLSGATTSALNFAASPRTACTVSSFASSKPGRRRTSSSPASSRMTNIMSLSGAAYVMSWLQGRSEVLHHLRHGGEQVRHQAVVGDAEDRRFLVLV